MIAELVPDFGELIIRWLAVIGAAALGGILSGVVLKLLVRFVSRRKIPALPLNGVRLLGAVALGLVVYLLVFGPGGSGLGFGGSGGWGLGGKGPGNGEGTTQPKGQPATAPSEPRGDRSKVLVVEMLGGERYKPLPGEPRVRDKLDKDKDPFYLVQGVEEPQTWEQVRERIEQRKNELTTLEIVFREKGSVGEQHQAVVALEELARRYSLNLRILKPVGP